MRGFCTWCGGSVLVARERGGDILIAAGTLDQPADVLEGIAVVMGACGEA